MSRACKVVIRSKGTVKMQGPVSGSLKLDVIQIA